MCGQEEPGVKPVADQRTTRSDLPVINSLAAIKALALIIYHLQNDGGTSQRDFADDSECRGRGGLLALDPRKKPFSTVSLH